MKVTRLSTLLLLHNIGCLQGSLETVFEKVLENVQSDVPAGRSVCFFHFGWDTSADLLNFAVTVISTATVVNFDVQKASEFNKVDVSITCSLNILFLMQESNLNEIFKKFSFEKYSKFIVLCRDLNSLRIATFMQSWGITSVLFIEQTDSYINLFMYNLLLSKKLPKSTLDGDLFPDKLSNLTGFPYSVTVLYTQSGDVETEHGQFIRLDLLDFIVTRQRTTGNYRIMYEKSPQIFRSYFDVIVPFLATYTFKFHEAIEEVNLPMTSEFCLVVPKVRDPQYRTILARPFQCQLWIFIIVGYCSINWIKKLSYKHCRKHMDSEFPLFERLKILFESLSLFILCEAYSAKLIALLSSPIDTVYPQSLAEFRSSSIQLLVPHPEFMEYAKNMPKLNGKYALWNQSAQYDRDKVALVDKCNSLKDETVPEPASDMGVVLSSSRYHVIPERLFVLQFSLLFNKRSPLVRKTREIVDRMYEAGVWQGTVKERKREAGKAKQSLGKVYPDAYYGIIPLYFTMVDFWVIAVILFIFQWIYVKVLIRFYYNAMFLIGLNVFLRK